MKTNVKQDLDFHKRRCELYELKHVNVDLLK